MPAHAYDVHAFAMVYPIHAGIQCDRMTIQRVLALLGRRDEPTDAVEEYCTNLGKALGAHGIQFEIRRVPWELCGWTQSLDDLRLQAASWRNTWILIQYTALAWSLRGLPVRFIQVLRILAAARARIGVIFHDVEPYPGTRLIDRLRRIIQLRTVRRAVDLADLAIFTVPIERVSWLSNAPKKAAFLPVGPNLPLSSQAEAHHSENAFNSKSEFTPSVCVFSITGGASGAREANEILSAVRFACEKIGRLRLSVFGRHAEFRESFLRAGLKNLPVELTVQGLLDGELVIEKLSACDVLLFVRGPISSRRSSAIAGISCGLPVVAYSGSETGPPITDAGVVLVSFDQDESSRQRDLNLALVRVLSDTAYRVSLSERSRRVYEKHFSWQSIASRLTTLLESLQ